MTGKLWSTYFGLQADIESICSKFNNPRVTVVIRAPELEDGDVVVGNDDLDEAIGAIRRLKARPPLVEPDSV